MAFPINRKDRGSREQRSFFVYFSGNRTRKKPESCIDVGIKMVL